MLPATIGVTAALALAVVLLYPAQVRAVRRPWRWAMPALRLAGILVLALSLLRPVAVSVRSSGSGGTVIAMIDRSASMDVADSGRRPADQVALASGLGLIASSARAGPATQPNALAQLVEEFARLRSDAPQAFRAQGDLDYARVSGRGIDAAQARLMESGGRLATLAQSIAAQGASIFTQPGEADTRDRIAALAKIARPDGRPGWAADARRRIEQADAALADHRTHADQRLFESDADVRDLCRGIDARTRFDLVSLALMRADTGLLARLGPSVPVEGFSFAEDVTRLGRLLPAPRSPDAAEDRTDRDDSRSGAAAAPPSKNGGAAGVGSPTIRPNLKPDGRRTDVAGAIAATVASLGPAQVRAIVVFSDGRQAGPPLAASPPAPAAVPVFTVAVAPATTPRDVAIGNVTLPRSAFVGETVTIRASILAAGVPANLADPLDARLKIDDGPERPPDRKTETPRSRDAIFIVKMEQAGAHRFTISIPTAPNEVSRRNNQVERWVKVLPEKIRVAAYSGSPGWDFQLVRGELGRTPWVTLESGVLGAAALSPEEIARQDVILLFDASAAALGADQWAAVHRLVRDRGGSVISVAGQANTPGDYASQPLAAQLLPFPATTVKPAWKTWPGEKPSFRLVPEPGLDPRRSEVLRLEAGDVTNRRWQELPGMFRLMPLPAIKAGAVAILIDADSRLPVLAESRVGLGRAFFLGADETWRWRFESGDQYHARFWRQLVHYAADEPYAARAGNFAIDADKVQAEPGEPVTVRARVYSDSGGATSEPPAPADVRVEVVSGGQIVHTQSMAESTPGSGRYATTLSSLPEGEYLLRLAARPSHGAAALLPHPAT